MPRLPGFTCPRAEHHVTLHSNNREFLSNTESTICQTVACLFAVNAMKASGF